MRPIWQADSQLQRKTYQILCESLAHGDLGKLQQYTKEHQHRGDKTYRL